MTPKVCGVGTVQNPRLAVDEWVPFWFQSDREGRSLPDCWLIGDERSSILDLTVDADTRSIIGAALPGYDGPLANALPEAFQGVPELPGVPVVGTEGFEKGMCRQFCAFTLARDGNRFTVDFQTGLPPARCLRSDRTGFFERSGALCGIGFFDLNEAEVETILSWHARMTRP